MRDPNHDFGSHDRELSLPDMSALYLVDINYSGSSERTDVQGGSLTGVKPTHKNETLKTTKRELNSPSQSEITSEQILTPTTSAYTPSSPSTCDSSCPEGDESTTPKNLVEKPAFGSFFDPWYPEAEDDKTSTPTNMVDSSTAPSFFDPWCPEVEDDKSETPTASTIYHDLLSAQIHQDELPPQSTTTTDPNKLSTLHKGYIKWLKKTTIEAWPHMSKGGDFELRHYREIHFKLHTGQMGSDDDSFATWAQLYGPLDRILHPANVEPEAWVIAYRTFYEFPGSDSDLLVLLANAYDDIKQTLENPDRVDELTRREQESAVAAAATHREITLAAEAGYNLIVEEQANNEDERNDDERYKGLSSWAEYEAEIMEKWKLGYDDRRDSGVAF